MEQRSLPQYENNQAIGVNFMANIHDIIDRQNNAQLSLLSARLQKYREGALQLSGLIDYEGSQAQKERIPLEHALQFRPDSLNNPVRALGQPAVAQDPLQGCAAQISVLRCSYSFDFSIDEKGLAECSRLVNQNKYSDR